MIDENQEKSLALLMHRSRIGEALHYTEWATKYSPSVLGSECSPCRYQARYLLRNGVSINLSTTDPHSWFEHVRVIELDDATGWRAIDDEGGLLGHGSTPQQAIAALFMAIDRMIDVEAG